MSLFLKEPPNSIVGADQNKTVQNHVDAFAVGPSFMSFTRSGFTLDCITLAQKSV